MNPQSDFINPLSLPMLPGVRQKERTEIEQLDIEQYFTREDLDQMSAYEKIRYQNILLNHTMLQSLGIPISKPEWMTKPLKKSTARDPTSSSDEEWAPQDSVGPRRETSKYRYNIMNMLEKGTETENSLLEYKACFN